MKHSLVLLTIAACLMVGCLPNIKPGQESTTPAVSTLTEPAVLSTSTSASLPSPTLEQEAPLCTSNPLAGACSVPTVSVLSRFCVKKVPYTLLGIPPSATFQALDEKLKCKDESIRGDVRQVSCTGQELYTYEIKVCDVNCASAQLADGGGRCPEGYGYSAEANCCWMPSTLEAGCVIYKVDIGACQ